MAAEAPPARSDSVLVRVDADASTRERAAVGRALGTGAGRALVEDWRVYALPSSVTLAQARERLADADAAEAVQLDAKLQALETPDDTHFALQWDLPAIDAPTGWDAAGGAAPVTVAVIDTGVDVSHPDLAGRLWENTAEIPGNGLDDDGNGYVDDVAGWNFYDWTNQVYSAVDGDSHGTHVAGTIAARRGNGAGIAGIADNARIMPLKFLKPGGGYASDAIVAIQYAVDHGATVINASWGGAGYSQPLCDAIDQAGDAGVLFVAAAGNASSDNDAVSMWPANCPSASLMSVASTTQSDGLSSFSNRGATQVDVGAPGSDILSTVPGGYGYKSGTSMAAPHVAGIAAVVAGLAPGLAPWQIKAAISTGGDVAPALAGATSSGRRADLAGAIAAAGAGVGADTTPPDPFGVVSPAEGLATSAAFPVFRWAPATDAQSGVSAYRLMVDGVQVAQVGPGVSEATAGSPLAEGSRTWSVVAVDAVGNLRATGARTLLVDRTAPSQPVPAAPADAAPVAGREVTLSWSAATDAGSGVASYRVLVDGAVAGSTGPGVRALRTGPNVGRHTWQVVAVDAAGNESVSAVRSFTVTGTAARRAVSVRPLRLTLPARTASGRPPMLRVQAARPARVTFTVRRASPVRRVAVFTRRVRSGVTDVALPAAVARRMRPAGTYVVIARAPAGMKDTVRLTVRR